MNHLSHPKPRRRTIRAILSQVFFRTFLCTCTRSRSHRLCVASSHAQSNIISCCWAPAPVLCVSFAHSRWFHHSLWLGPVFYALPCIPYVSFYESLRFTPSLFQPFCPLLRACAYSSVLIVSFFPVVWLPLAFLVPWCPCVCALLPAFSPRVFLRLVVCERCHVHPFSPTLDRLHRSCRRLRTWR